MTAVKWIDANMCPQCGSLFYPARPILIPIHGDESGEEICMGSEQNPRNPNSDRRPLWSGASNLHFCG